VSELRCDADGCTSRIELPDDVTQYTAGVVAEREGWLVKHGQRRDYHWCPKHREAAP